MVNKDEYIKFYIQYACLTSAVQVVVEIWTALQLTFLFVKNPLPQSLPTIPLCGHTTES